MCQHYTHFNAQMAHCPREDMPIDCVGIHQNLPLSLHSNGFATSDGGKTNQHRPLAPTPPQVLVGCSTQLPFESPYLLREIDVTNLAESVDAPELKCPWFAASSRLCCQ
jgi:hypothetical protein